MSHPLDSNREVLRREVIVHATFIVHSWYENTLTFTINIHRDTFKVNQGKQNVIKSLLHTISYFQPFSIVKVTLLTYFFAKNCFVLFYQMFYHHIYNYAQQSSIICDLGPVDKGLNGRLRTKWFWVQISLQSIQFRYCACFTVSGPYRVMLTTRLTHVTSLAKWFSV